MGTEQMEAVLWGFIDILISNAEMTEQEHYEFLVKIWEEVDSRVMGMRRKIDFRENKLGTEE